MWKGGRRGDYLDRTKEMYPASTTFYTGMNESTKQNKCTDIFVQ
jgi:hypothetical protein